MHIDPRVQPAFDFDAYLTVPHLTAEGTVALATALVAAAPHPTPDVVDRIARRLALEVRDAEEALTIRRRESAPVDHSGEVALDALCDGLWSVLRERLRSWSAFEHPAFDPLLEGMPCSDAAMLRRARERAERARALSGRVLGPEGLAFTQRPYPEQAQRMAAILRMVDEDGLAASLDELVGREVLVGLRHAQARYEAMVERRMVRSEGRSIDLSQLRRRLGRTIARYARAVLVMLDEDDPASFVLVRDALRPLEVARAQARQARGRTRPAVAERDGSAPEPEVDAPSGSQTEASAEAVAEPAAVSAVAVAQ